MRWRQGSHSKLAEKLAAANQASITLVYARLCPAAWVGKALTGEKAALAERQQDLQKAQSAVVKVGSGRSAACRMQLDPGRWPLRSAMPRPASKGSGAAAADPCEIA